MKIRVLDEDLYAEELGRGSQGKQAFGPKQPGDAGIDLRATRDVEISWRETVAIPLGVGVEILESHVGWITGRSSTVTALGLLTHEGKIDSGYRGQIHAIVTALSRDVEIARGERIAQLVVLPIVPPDSRNGHAGWQVVDELSSSERGKMGLGSTGRV